MARSIFISQIRDTGNILAGLTTANLVEGSNLYFTNARVYSNVIALLPTLAGSGIQIQANGQINSSATLTLASLSPFLTTSNVAEGSNLYYTNARVVSAVLPYLTTSNVSEGSNLYYTNARVRSALSGGTGVSYDNSTGAISIGQNVSSTADVTFTNLTVSGDLVVQGNTVTLNASTVNIEDKNLLLANGAINAAAADGAGITIYGANANITYVSATNSWNLNKDIIVTSNVNAGNIIATAHQGTIWTGIYTANVIESGSALYYTNARVNSNVIAFLPSLAGSGIAIQANGQISANTQSVSLAGLSTTNLAEGSNLYYTNTRARTAFTAGKGITILGDGTIKSTAAGGDYNISLSGATGYIVSNVMAGITFTGSVSDRFILRSLQVTNISDSNAAYVSSNVLYSGGNTAYLGNLISVPLGGVAEFISRTQVFQPGDSIYLQGFDNNYTATSNILSAFFTYETINSDESYIGIGQTLANANSNVSLLIADTTDLIIESVKFVNLRPTNIPIRLYVANTTTLVPKAYLAYNMQVPTGSSLEILQSPKVLKTGETLYARYANSSNADSIAVFTSYRKSEQTTVSFTTSSVSIGNTVIATFNTSVEDGTVLYYTIR